MPGGTREKTQSQGPISYPPHNRSMEGAWGAIELGCKKGGRTGRETVAVMILYYIVLPIVWVLIHILWRIEVIGLDRVPRDRPVVLAPNHIFGP